MKKIKKNKAAKVFEFGPETAELEQALGVVQEGMRTLHRSVTGLDRDLHAMVYELMESPDGRVEVKTLVGREARRLAGEVITDVKIGDDDIRRTRRLPGLMAASPATIEALEALNAAKERFEGLTAKLPRGTDGERRAAILKRVCPLMQLGQISRTVPALKQAPAWASFIWASAGTSNKPMNREEALEMLERHERYCPRDANPPGCEAMVARARVILAKEPAGQHFVQARPVAPHLRVNLRIGGKRLQRHAYLPIFYPATATLPQSFAPGPLPSAQDPPSRRARARRSDYKRENEPLVQGLHLYRRLTIPRKP